MSKERCDGCGRKLYSTEDASVRRDGHEDGCPVERQADALERIASSLSAIEENIDDSE